jgi:hypothetical protein|tara:strand:+ start:1883 stop:2290 length:408 start_codon:yes stop_codon:yes gene_type:complete
VSESSAHIYLVDVMSKYIANKYFESDMGRLLIDSPQNSKNAKPFKVNGYKPDIYAKKEDTMVILGEAKTDYDLDRKHSIEQFNAFLKYCSGFDDSIFVLAVPWYLSIHGKKILQNIQEDREFSSVRIEVIDKIVV